MKQTMFVLILVLVITNCSFARVLVFEYTSVNVDEGKFSKKELNYFDEGLQIINLVRHYNGKTFESYLVLVNEFKQKACDYRQRMKCNNSYKLVRLICTVLDFFNKVFDSQIESYNYLKKYNKHESFFQHSMIQIGGFIYNTKFPWVFVDLNGNFDGIQMMFNHDFDAINKKPNGIEKCKRLYAYMCRVLCLILAFQDNKEFQKQTNFQEYNNILLKRLLFCYDKYVEGLKKYSILFEPKKPEDDEVVQYYKNGR